MRFIANTLGGSSHPV